MTKGQVELPVGVILAEGGLAAGRAAREAQGLGGGALQTTAKARGRMPVLRGLKTKSRKAVAGVVEHAYAAVTQKIMTSRSSSTI